MASRDEKLALLQGCIDLPQLNDTERGLMRTIAHVYGRGEEALWGAANGDRATEVLNLFFKCQTVLNVSHAQV